MCIYDHVRPWKLWSYKSGKHWRRWLIWCWESSLMINGTFTLGNEEVGSSGSVVVVACGTSKNLSSKFFQLWYSSPSSFVTIVQSFVAKLVDIVGLSSWGSSTRWLSPLPPPPPPPPPWLDRIRPSWWWWWWWGGSWKLGNWWRFVMGWLLNVLMPCNNVGLVDMSSEIDGGL